MYTFSSKLKTFSFILMILGLLGVGYAFFTAPSTVQEVEAILAEQHDGHDSHSTVVHNDAAEHKEHTTTETEKTVVAPVAVISTDSSVANTSILKDTIAVSSTLVANKVVTAKTPIASSSYVNKNNKIDEHAEHQAHLEHVLHQLSNKPWAAVYVAAIFFLLLTMGVLAFYAIQIVAQAGWSPVLFRVMQGITAYLPVGSIIFFILLILSGLHFNHLFVWMDADVVAADKLIQNKSGYLNFPFWIARAAIFLIGWNLYNYYTKKFCLAQDRATDNLQYKKNFNASAIFMVFFIVSESIMSWDWIMSVDPHWFSTLFGWYVFASFFVSGITVIMLVTIFMKSLNLLPNVNTSHLHDLAKFIFGFSIFWTYLWFSQFMLIWYANIPEEVTYFITRIEDYQIPFFATIGMNFLFPVLILINTDFKRISWILVMAGIVILLGHYVDFFVMIMPATVGDQWFIGIAEIGSVLFFLGLFIFVVFTAMAKSPLLPERHPLIEESKHFHY
ncbi:quinol:cytochrome C oxidoreductase [Flavobacterium ardleyense]|uniref:quinol:cytochrome C oxidoreductase n=1 Tax=Flavobacterium ardleyense TaxID=2038737 RepID=UPI00298BCF1E|nr:quinol:cytochrome C oxidoreductase [Flavobacterium ardleyense]